MISTQFNLKVFLSNATSAMKSILSGHLNKKTNSAISYYNKKKRKVRWRSFKGNSFIQIFLVTMRWLLIFITPVLTLEFYKCRPLFFALEWYINEMFHLLRFSHESFSNAILSHKFLVMMRWLLNFTFTLTFLVLSSIYRDPYPLSVKNKTF